jgi:hypothetical protein
VRSRRALGGGLRRFFVLYTLWGGFKAALAETDTTRRILTVIGRLLLAPLAYGAGWVMGIWLWPLALIGIFAMLITPFRLMTKSGRNDLAYTVRWGRRRDRPR